MSTTTFDYIPRIILGKSNSYIYNSINLVIRAIAFYIYFKTMSWHKEILCMAILIIDNMINYQY